MLRTDRVVTQLLTVLALAGALDEACAQEDYHYHVRELMESSSEMPEDVAVLTVALAEAAVAAEYAGYAAGGAEYPGDLTSMQMHARHVLHAIDPSRIAEGPGLGVGVRRATERIIHHVEMAAGATDAAAGVEIHARHVTTAARSTLATSDRILALVTMIQTTESPEDAAALTDELEAVSRQLTTGLDADGDGVITWREGEGGLGQVRQHLELLAAVGGS